MSTQWFYKVLCVFLCLTGRDNPRSNTDHILKDTYVKLNFGSESSLSEDTANSATNEEQQRGLGRKQNRHRGGTSYERVQNVNPTENSDVNTPKYDSKQRTMNSVNLVGLKTNGHHFQEPHYEAIRDLSIKRSFKSHSNSTTPEGSPKLFHSRKYVLNNGLPLSAESSPKLSRTKKDSTKNPPLPTRNHHSKSPSTIFYSETGNNNNIYGNTSPFEHPYTDVKLQNMKNKQFNPLKVDHPYSEITPRPRRSLNSSDNDGSPVQSPDRIIPHPFDKTRMFQPAIVIDGSKSDGDLSDSDILDVKRMYNRRRSRTGNDADLPDPATIFYAVPDENKPRHLKQPYRNGSYEKDYCQTFIKPRPKCRSANSSLKLLDYPTYENSNSLSFENNELTYENNILHRGSSTDDDSEPTYENPDIRIITPEPYSTHVSNENTYENNGLLHDEAPIPGYACIRPSSASSDTDANYNNICFNKKDQLMYADIDIINRRLYDNLSSPEVEYSSSSARNSRTYSVTKNSKYTQFQCTSCLLYTSPSPRDS